MKIGETLDIDNRTAWRRWLNAHWRSEDEIWIVYHRAHTGVPRIAYNDAVEEALCFGWIDSIVRTIDDDAYAQRFTPRSATSSFSQTNRERLRRLLEQGTLMPEVEAAVADVLAEPFVTPPDIEAALRADASMWKNLTRYSDAYQRIGIAYVETGRRRPDEFEKRLANLLRKTAADTQFGFGIETYY